MLRALRPPKTGNFWVFSQHIMGYDPAKKSWVMAYRGLMGYPPYPNSGRAKKYGVPGIMGYQDLWVKGTSTVPLCYHVMLFWVARDIAREIFRYSRVSRRPSGKNLSHRIWQVSHPRTVHLSSPNSAGHDFHDLTIDGYHIFYLSDYRRTTIVTLIMIGLGFLGYTAQDVRV